jgi:hypothetical protein
MQNRMKFFQLLSLSALLLLCFSVLNPVNGQNDRPAKLDKQTKIISLDETVPFGYSYYLDIENMNFASRAEAKQYFRPYNTPFVTFSVHFEEQIVNIELQLREKGDWEIKDWNTYLATLTAVD